MKGQCYEMGLRDDAERRAKEIWLEGREQERQAHEYQSWRQAAEHSCAATMARLLSEAVGTLLGKGIRPKQVMTAGWRDRLFRPGGYAWPTSIYGWALGPVPRPVNRETSEGTLTKSPFIVTNTNPARLTHISQDDRVRTNKGEPLHVSQLKGYSPRAITVSEKALWTDVTDTTLIGKRIGNTYHGGTLQLMPGGPAQADQTGQSCNLSGAPHFVRTVGDFDGGSSSSWFSFEEWLVESVARLLS
jgi:hypothetical protein